MNAKELNQRFGISGAVVFEAGAGGLTRATIAAAGGEAHVYLHGAHVTHWRPAGRQDVIWVSRKSLFQPGKPIRGGVPVCWPWFGNKADAPSAPMHGFARLMEWEVESAAEKASGEVGLVLVLRSSDATRARWPGEFELRLRVTVGSALLLELETGNKGDGPLAITEALHTYFRVGDVRKASVAGLAGAEYLDKVEGFRRKRQEGPVTFARETDRLYVATESACVLDDPVLARRITIAKSGSRSTVVWNPWVAKAAAMSDYGHDEWPEMLCIETANAADNALKLGPGEVHRMEARLSVE